MGEPHVDHAKLQCLELADGLPELLARSRVLDGVQQAGGYRHVITQQTRGSTLKKPAVSRQRAAAPP